MESSYLKPDRKLSPELSVSLAAEAAVFIETLVQMGRSLPWGEISALARGVHD
jgi:hypothetical protein